MLTNIVNNLRDFPVKEPQPLKEENREAAVLLALTDEPEPHLVLTLRAQHLNDHAGEVALPGGMWEAEDGSLLHTALRESHEEVDLPAELVKVVATLPVRVTRYGVRVTPFVGVIPKQVDLQPEESELDEVFRVPLSFLAEKGNLGRDLFEVAGDEYLLPCYHFRHYRIWGFTLGVLADFLNHGLNAGITLDYSNLKTAR